MCRVGGDEFMVILPNIDGSQDLENIQAKIHEQFEYPVIGPEISIEISASIGYAIYPTHGRSAATLIKRADSNMYTAKRAKPKRARAVAKA